MEVLDNIITRRSYRVFKNDPILKSDLNIIIEAASNSPSYTNTQPWELAIVTGKKKDELAGELLELAKMNASINPDIPKPESWPPVLEARSREHGKRRLETLGISRSDKEGREKLRLMNYEFYGAPCALFFFVISLIFTGYWLLLIVGVIVVSHIDILSQLETYKYLAFELLAASLKPADKDFQADSNPSFSESQASSLVSASSFNLVVPSSIFFSRT